MDTTDWLLVSLVLVGYANWYATDPFRGSSWATAALVVAGVAVLLDVWPTVVAVIDTTE